MVEAEITGSGQINRPESMGVNRRRAEKLNSQSTWFKKKPKNVDTSNPRKRRSERHDGPQSKRAKLESVLFIPFSRNSSLKKEVQQVKDSLTREKLMVESVW